MNVLSSLPAAAAPAPTAAASAAVSNELAGVALPLQAASAFGQVWDQQTLALLGGAAAQALPPSEEAAAPDVPVQAFAVELSDVLPAVHLPAQSTAALHAQQRAAQAQEALGLGPGETLEADHEAADSLLSLQNLSPLPVVHPQLRRAAVTAVEASAVQTVGGAAQTGSEAVLRSAAAVAPLPDVSSANTAAPVAAASAASPEAKPSALVQALGQRIQVQQAQGQDVVTVRLDPPQWGRIEIRIQQDAAGLQVMLQASHAEVGRQLTVLSDSLRQELQARTAGEATVVVHSQRAHAGQQGQGERQGTQDDNAWQGDLPVGQALQFELTEDAV